MDLDDHVCLCFRVTRRKLENYVRLYRPRVASQLSECGGAGTGCGWCVPFLKQIFQRAVRGGVIELETLTPEEYDAAGPGTSRKGRAPRRRGPSRRSRPYADSARPRPLHVPVQRDNLRGRVLLGRGHRGRRPHVRQRRPAGLLGQ